MAKLKDGKTENITIRITEELRTRLEALHKKYYPEIPFNSFLGHLVGKGADEEEYIARYKDRRAEIKEKGEAEVLEKSLKPDSVLKIAQLESRLNMLIKAIDEGKTLGQYLETPSTIFSELAEKARQNQETERRADTKKKPN